MIAGTYQAVVYGIWHIGKQAGSFKEKIVDPVTGVVEVKEKATLLSKCVVGFYVKDTSVVPTKYVEMPRFYTFSTHVKSNIIRELGGAQQIELVGKLVEVVVTPKIGTEYFQITTVKDLKKIVPEDRYKEAKMPDRLISAMLQRSVTSTPVPTEQPRQLEEGF